MSLNNYILNGPQVVIYDDGRDPYVSWQHHLERTNWQRGGVDMVAVVGTPVYAPTDGWWDWLPNDGGAGNSGRFRHADNAGWADVFSHLSRYVGWSGKFFYQGEVIGYSGNSGGVIQHLHRHLLDPQGRRQNPWDYFTPQFASSGELKPIIIKEDSMTQAILLNDKHYFTIGEEFISHNDTTAQADITRKVNSVADELHSLNTDSFYDYLDGMGIPRNVVDLETGAVKNPETGFMEINGVWSRRRQSVAMSKQILALLEPKNAS